MTTPRWNDGITHWNGGAYWPPVPGPRRDNNMATIALNVSKMPVADKIVRGQDIITKSTNNPAVPGNGASLTAFSNAQADLIAANDAYEGARTTCMNHRIARDNALTGWLTALKGLAGVTENETAGDAEKITSTGFDIRHEATPTPPVDAPTNVMVQTNGTPGVSKISFECECAETFLIQRSTDPDNESSWVLVLVTTKMHCEVPGAEPGKPCWFRIAGVNPSGQGPWSEPARRPVM
jgi:hypothetical protein